MSGRDFEAMPKVELHLHLEGAVPLDAMWTLAEGRDPEVPDRQALADRYVYRDFGHFIETWIWQTRFLDSYEAFEFAAEAVAADLARQQIVYAEAFFSPSDFARHGLEPGALAAAIRRGLDRIGGTEVALIADLVRDTGPQRAGRTFDAVREAAADAGVIGIGLGGLEAEFPPELFGDVYRRAAAAGFRRTAHAGEAAGPGSVRGALDALGAERIGHGIRAVEDPGLLERLVAEQVPLEVCPTSNLRTGVIDSWEDHPAARFIAAGALVTLNSDDPAMFHTSVTEEFRRAGDHLGADEAVLRRLSRNAIAASWADAATKQRLAADVDDWWAAG